MTSNNHLTPAALAELDAAHRERMNACECPYCNWPVTA